MEVKKERIHKILAQLGLGSRRQIEKWIVEGKIKVNGKVAQLGMVVSAEDKVNFEGKFIELQKVFSHTTRILVYNKPEGEICTRHDPEGRPTIYENLPRLRVGRWISVGRLDINSQGLILLTNEGELANRLMHPKYQIEREYASRIFGEVTALQKKALLQGVLLEDGLAKFEKILYKGGEGLNQWYHVIVLEGKQREVRRLWESQGVKVSRLIRVRYGSVILPRELRRGHWQELTEDEIKIVYKSVNL